MTTPSNGLYTTGERKTATGAPDTIANVPLHEVTPRDPRKASIGGLVKNAMEQVSTLFRAEFELAKTEITDTVKKGVTGSVFFIIAGVLALLSLTPFMFMWAKLISMWMGTMSWDWFGFLVVFLFLLLLAVVFALLGLAKVKKVKAPTKTQESVKELKTVLPKGSSKEKQSPLTSGRHEARSTTQQGLYS